MSSKRKEKKIKGTDTVPLPPATEIANFSYTPQKYSKDQRCHHSQFPSKRLSHPIPPPPRIERLTAKLVRYHGKGLSWCEQ